jgi:hypothetical protein
MTIGRRRYENGLADRLLKRHVRAQRLIVRPENDGHLDADDHDHAHHRGNVGSKPVTHSSSYTAPVETNEIGIMMT